MEPLPDGGLCDPQFRRNDDEETAPEPHTSFQGEVPPGLDRTCVLVRQNHRKPQAHILCGLRGASIGRFAA